MAIIEKIHGKEYKHNVSDIEGYVDPTTAAQAVVNAHKAETDAHAAGNITNTPAGNIAAITVQTAINELDSEKVDKSGSITQITTRNHNDLQNLNAGSAHPSASIDNTSTSYGKGLATTDTTVQKIADRVNQNGTPQFITDKTKCSLLLDFNGTLSDKTAGINPIGFDSANKWTDNFVNDSTTKANATNISCTLKQFEGDEGLFGSGVAVEESRTNLFTQSEDLTSGTWIKNSNTTVSFDRVLPDGQKLYKIVPSGAGACLFYKLLQPDSIKTYTMSISCYCLSPGLVLQCMFDGGVGLYLCNPTVALKRYSLTGAGGISLQAYGFSYTARSVEDVLYITSPQLEVGSFPTSYIATGATAVTRPAGKLNYDPKLVNINSNYTVSFWAKSQHNYNSIGEFALIRINTVEDYKYGIYFEGSTGKYTFQAGTQSIEQSIAYTSNTDLQKYHHFTMSKNGTAYHFSIDGVWKKSLYNVETGAPSIFSVGSANGAWISNSTISNFEIFNYALSEAEISQIYNSGLEGKPVASTNPQNIIPVGQSLYDTLFTTYASGWGISSTYPNKPTFSKNDNVAMLRGILEYSGVVNSDTTLFTLPVGARPSIPDTYFNSFIVSSRDSGAPSVRIIRVYGNGNVVLMAQGATITNPTISLDNISFINGK